MSYIYIYIEGFYILTIRCQLSVKCRLHSHQSVGITSEHLPFFVTFQETIVHVWEGAIAYSALEEELSDFMF